MDTPGRRLILDLLAKSVAKINAAESNHKNQTQSQESLKRKNMRKKSPEKKKKTKNIQIEHKGVLSFQEEDIKPTKTEVKTEYSEIKTESLEMKADNTQVKTECTESESSAIKREDSGRHIKIENERNVNKSKCRVQTSGGISTKVPPGRAFILDLLQTSAAKINATESKKETHGLKTENVKDFGVEVATKAEYIEAQFMDAKTKSENNFKKEKFSNNEDLCQNVKMKEIQDKRINRNTKSSESEINPSKVKRDRKFGTEVKKFTPEEDKIILYEMETYGDQINSGKLAKELNRKNNSVIYRIEKLKSGKSWREVRQYTLTEDLVIMDAVLKKLAGKTLEKLDLPSFKEWKVVGDQIGRQERHVKYRWEYYLKTWLLQHFSGTLNLDIRRMLANHLAENFENVDSVDWQEVASRPEFAGNTVISLKYVFYNKLLTHTKEKTKASSEEITLKHIADVTNNQFKENKLRKIMEKILTRQKDVIKYFEEFVKNSGQTFQLN